MQTSANMMHEEVGLSEPIFELKGLAGRIDLSAWLSGASFFAGVTLCDHAVVAEDIFSVGAGAQIMLAAFLAFIVSVLLIQRYMRLSLLANTFGSPRRLVTGGVFAYSRNPIYVAFIVPLASLAYFSLSAAIAAIGLYILAMNLTVIRKEERDLFYAFGDEYTAYLRSAPRWIV